MPIIDTPDIRTRALAHLRTNKGRRFTMAELGAEIGCGLSTLAKCCQDLAQQHPDIWFAKPPSPGVAARVCCAAKTGKPPL